MRRSIRMFLVFSLMSLVCLGAEAQRGGGGGRSPAGRKKPTALKKSAKTAKDDLDYQAMYKHIPKEEFPAAIKSLDFMELKKKNQKQKKQFEYRTLTYPTGEENSTSYRFDMGPADAPVKKGYTKITKDDVFSWEKGFGWSMSPAADDYAYTGPDSLTHEKARDYAIVQKTFLEKAFARRDRTSRSHVRMMPLDQLYDPYMDDLARDAVLKPEELPFKITLPNGRYMVSMVVGDLQIPRYGIDIYANGYLVASNIFTGWIQFRGYSEPASPWPLRITFPVNVVGNNLRITLRANDDLFFERCETSAETPRYVKSQLPYVLAKEGIRLRKFLGKPMSLHGPATQMAIAGITVTPFEGYPITMTRQKLFPSKRLANADALEGIELFNAGDMKGAEEAFARIPDSEYMTKALGYLGMMGHLDVIVKEELRLIDQAIAVLTKGLAANPDDILAEDILKGAEMFRAGLDRIDRASELGAGEAFTTSAALFNWTSPEDIWYEKSLMHYARCFAAIDPHRWVTSWQIAEEAFLKLQELVPDNRYSGYYLYWDMDGWDFKDYTKDIAGAPKWAIQMREAYNRMLDQAEWWGLNRQTPEGKIGGGWGDDVEIGLVWEVLMLVNPDASPVAMETTRGIAEGVWWGGEIDRDTGYFDGIADVEHTAEWTGDSQAVMIGIEYGNPVYFERNLKIAKLMKDLWMGRTERGHLHFKSMVLGNKAIGHSYGNVRDADIDHPLQGRATSPAYWNWWYSPVDEIDRLFRDWADAWYEDTMRAENGKPAGVIPGPIGFPSDTIGGNNMTTWAAGAPKGNVYSNPTYMNYIVNLFSRMYLKTGDEKWIQAKTAKYDSVQLTGEYPGIADNVADLKIEDKYERLEKVGLQKTLDIIAMTWPSITSETAQTDRIAIPGVTDMLGLLTGGKVSAGLDFIPLTFEKTSRNIAFMCLEASKTAGKVILFNFNDNPEPVNMKLWRLEVGGKYEVVYGADTTDDDEINDELGKLSFRLAHRGDPFSITIPARQAVVVEVKQTKPGRGMPERIVDLAMSPEDIKYEDGKLSVTVHNIGNKDCGSFNFNVYQANKDKNILLESFTVDRLGAPNDLDPRTATRALEWLLPQRATANMPVKILVEVDPDDQHYEITERNNVITRSFPFEMKSYMTPRVWKSLASELGIKKWVSFPEGTPKDQIR
ncbi:CARDB domain-containing protein [Candidatus Hydrogenedentota bacterium]